MSSAAFSKDSALVAIAADSRIQIYSLATGTFISTLAVSGQNVYSLEFSPDGTKLLSGDRDGHVFVSDVATGQTEARLDSGNMYYRVVFSADGKQVASADQDGKVRIWDLASRSIVKTLTGHTAAVKVMQFSPDTRLLATAADDNTVRIWDLASGKELKQPIRSNAVQRLAFTPDGKRLVTASYDGQVILWDVAEMQEVITLQRGGGPATSLTFSQDGLTLAISDEKGAVRVWRAGQPPL